MTGITPGIIMTVTGAAGIIGCLIGLIATAAVFPKQRKKLLQNIETE
ncbi:MAG TPA: hypothetical protein H9748_11940 [Candidatus Mediterraneibacter norwichensis]|nr:hypothetical protein [Candidatus Mediterraneibacter norwichensis]